MKADITITSATSERTCRMRRKVEKEDEQIQFQSNKVVSINAKIIPLQERLFTTVAPYIYLQDSSLPQEFS
jgi:hypothetical protein